MSNEVQSKFIKSTLYVVIGILLLGFILVQPYNFFCKAQKTCQQITFSSFSLHKNGHQKMAINFAANVPEELKSIIEFEPTTAEIKILNGKNITNSFQVKNLSEDAITIGARFKVEPAKMVEYLERIECLCSKHQPLNALEESLMPINLRIKPEIEQDSELKNIREIKVSYEIYLVE
ncbi:MAG: cytochrome c oxidase assembly protein subunit 11 [Rickettsiales bacterium]|jgi:cytochrome c oxidase assembly protein subunit 11